jgi:hypothetical protein
MLLWRAAQAGALVAAVFTLLVFVKSLSDFTRTGPQMADEVLRHYRLYLAASLAQAGVLRAACSPRAWAHRRDGLRARA